MALNLQTPSLVFGKMPVEHVHIVHSQDVDELLNEANGEEMATAIEHHTTIAKAWSIGNIYCRQSDVGAIGLHGQRLTQGLNAIEHASGSASGDGYLLVVNGKAISFVALHFGIDNQNNGCSLLVAFI